MNHSTSTTSVLRARPRGPAARGAFALLAAALVLAGCDGQRMAVEPDDATASFDQRFDSATASPGLAGCDPRSRGFWHRQCMAVGLAPLPAGVERPELHPGLPAGSLELLLLEADLWLAPAVGRPVTAGEPGEPPGGLTCATLAARADATPCPATATLLATIELNLAGGFVDPGGTVRTATGRTTQAEAVRRVRDLLFAGDCAPALALATTLADGTACQGTVEDADGDGIPDDADLCPFAPDPAQRDADHDGRGDACDACPTDPADDADSDRWCADQDNCPWRTNFDQADRDADGLGDACDPCPDEATGGDADADADGRGDACDPCPLDATNDGDGDGTCEDVDTCPGLSDPSQLDRDDDGTGDICDNCPETSNPDQLDSDRDGFGDLCDDGDDGDRDGLLDGDDNCPRSPNPGQEDADGDRLGDACDTCPHRPDPGQEDTDADGIGDACDVCPTVDDPRQADLDGDGLGDACDPCPTDAANDRDLDGRCADQDNCPVDWNPDQADADGDGLGDACDGDSPRRSD